MTFLPSITQVAATSGMTAPNTLGKMNTMSMSTSSEHHPRPARHHCSSLRSLLQRLACLRSSRAPLGK